VYKLATDTNTPLHHWNNKQLIFNPAGEPLPAEQTERLSTLLWEIIDEAFKFSEKARDEDDGKGIPSQDSLQDFIRRRAEEVVADEVERKLLVQMSEVFGAYVGEPVWKQSLRFAWMEECCGGGVCSLTPDFIGVDKTDAGGQTRCLSSQPSPRSFSAPRSQH